MFWLIRENAEMQVKISDTELHKITILDKPAIRTSSCANNWMRGRWKVHDWRYDAFNDIKGGEVMFDRLKDGRAVYRPN